MVGLEKCCCAFSLAKGTVGTGIFSTLESVAYIVAGGDFIYNSQFQGGGINGIIDDNTLLLIVGIISMVVGSGLLTTSITLICGVRKRNRRMIIPWLIKRGIMLIFDVASNVLLVSTGMFITAILRSGWIVVVMYLYAVVVSYYMSLKEQYEPSDLDPLIPPEQKQSTSA